MKVLVAGIPNSIHLARWMAATVGSRHTFYVLPSVGPLPYHVKLIEAASRSPGRIRLLHPIAGISSEYVESFLSGWKPKTWRSTWFKLVAQRLRPDLIQASELQHAGYEWLDALPPNTPFFGSCYGNDISLFNGFEHHGARLRHLLWRASFLQADCHRDLELARKLGFSGLGFAPLLCNSGVDLVAMRRYRRDPPSSRRVLAIRGYNGWSGRGLTTLDALIPIKDLVNQFEVVVYSAQDDVIEHANGLNRDFGLKLTTLRAYAPQEDVLKLFGTARAVVATSISDGASNAMIEGMAAGALPIQTTSSCATEYVRDGVSALLTDPYRAETVTAAVERALTDDALIDSAARINWETSENVLEENVQAAQIRAMYDEIEVAIQLGRGLPNRAVSADGAARIFALSGHSSAGGA